MAPSRSDRAQTSTSPSPAVRDALNDDLSAPDAITAPGDIMTVVGIGASAGGLDASRQLVASMPEDTGLAFILVQHLDPTHDSLMADLLSAHTRMPVVQAAEGMALERDHIYIIPPGTYLSVANAALHLSRPTARHGARLPFDHLLKSLAEQFGAHAIGVVLSGTGADGTIGLQAIKAQGGLVIAQNPEEAAYDGMPRSAIASGAADKVLPVAQIPEALVAHVRLLAVHPPAIPTPGQHEKRAARLGEIIALLRARTGHDFTQYKSGTLLRRIERRMTATLRDAGDIDAYIALLDSGGDEPDQLAKDLLIHVTRFFRDPKVFDALAAGVVPEMVRDHPPQLPLRLWVAACSTGEEAYSLAILFREAAVAEGRAIRLQVFASDIDADAVATAREGLYPAAIAADMSPARLAANFIREGDRYRINPELRATVVFTVQDVLTDPPFSRIDFVSCRNMLIYLKPEAQAKVVTLFHFALRSGGMLLLGNAETIVGNEGRFVEVAKAERLYRHVGLSRPGELSFTLGDGARPASRQGVSPVRSRQTVLGDLVQRLVVQAYAPASVLVNRRNECLYSVGPIDRYLRVAPGDLTSDLLAMARHHMQARLRAALDRATRENTRVVIPGGKVVSDGHEMPFSIAVQPVKSDGEDMLLVCFLDERKQARSEVQPFTPQEGARVVELEQELEATRTELQGAIRNLELSSEDQKAINEEALSVNEEFQSTNEELLTSKEELQSLNEELTALNTQLQESLERKRTAANDLQNVLNSTDVATIFLDVALNIRLFTPATRVLFNILPGDLGRPLADLSSLAFDEALLPDARAVLRTQNPEEREIETHGGQWFVRRVLPYRTSEGDTEGVVITFVDATERKRVADALQLAKRDAEMANVAKSRFVAAASHDLRQPLQTLSLLQGLLVNAVAGTKASTLVARLGDTLGAMSGMLNTLLDLNQIEAGTIQAERVDFPVNDLLTRLRDEFNYVAQAKGLTMHMVPCALVVRSDPRLLEQMLRNLLANAVKYTRHGKLLLGCRRRGSQLLIEIWDTGIGIPASELNTIFDEYHQIDNTARERSRGLGLGLSIVQHLGKLLGHAVVVRSNLGRGSVFSVEVQVPAVAPLPLSGSATQATADEVLADDTGAGIVLVIEDDPDLRDLLEVMVSDEGHRVVTAPDGTAALDMVARGKVRPDLVLCDYNLPNGMNGLQTAARLRQALRRPLPVIILTGDTSTETLRAIASDDCIHMHKPAKMATINGMIEKLLAQQAATEGVTRVSVAAQVPPAATPQGATSAAVPSPASRVQTVHVIDDDRLVCDGIRTLLEEQGLAVEDYRSAETFLGAYRPGGEDCLLLDVYLPAMTGLELVHELRRKGHGLPVVMITGKGDISMAVQAMKAGALDFVEKPVNAMQLLTSIEHALNVAHDTSRMLAWRESATHHVAGLTPRQREIMDLVLAGHPSKNIAADLGISQRTVENHRASIMRRTETRSLPALARLVLAASGKDAATSLPPPAHGPKRTAR